MALRLRHWVGLVLLSCAAISVAYLPPSNEAAVRRYRTQADDNAARVAQRLLARQIRELRQRRDLALLRDETLARLDRNTVRTDRPVVFTTAEVPERLRAQVQRALQTQWNDLGRPSRVDVAMFLRLAHKRSGDTLAPLPPPHIEVVTLLPQATDGSTCVRIATINVEGRFQVSTSDFGRDAVDHFLTTSMGIGLCGFYAAFGEPGQTVTTWLEEADYRFGFVADWDGSVAVRASTIALREGAQNRNVYNFPPVAFACAAGKEKACAKIVRGEGGRIGVFTPKSIGNGWIEERILGPWQLSRGGWHLGGREMFMLSELVTQFGHESFQEFWETSQPFETAFFELTGARPASWSREWVQRQFGVVRAGPSVSIGFIGLALLVCAASAAIGSYFAVRRQY